MSPVDDALPALRTRGWTLIPVHAPDPAAGTCSCGDLGCRSPGKHPVAKDWATGEADDRRFRGRNVGFVPGPTSADTAGVDLDCPEAVAAGPHLLPHTPCAFGRGGAVTHHLFRATGGAADLKLADPVLAGGDATLVELR